MSKPDEIPEWAADANFPMDAEPEQGTPTKVAPTSGQQLVGWRPKQRPPSRVLNWWMNRVSRWIKWSQEDKTEQISPAAWTLEPAKAWSLEAGKLFFVEPGVSQALYAMTLPVGAAIKSFTAALMGDAAETASIRVRSVARNLDGTLSEITHAAVEVVPPNGVYDDYAIDFESSTAAVALDATAAVSMGGVYHRASGSFVDDGFRVGMTIQPSGFANAGNNLPRVISSVTPTEIDVVDITGMVDETGTGAEIITAVPIEIEAGRSYTVTIDNNYVVGNNPIGLSTASMVLVPG